MALYNAAIALVYPSVYEGFGLPVVEAMACGRPVIAANTSSLPEVAGDGALLVDPFDVSALAGHGATDRNPREAEELGERGLARVAEFSWRRTAARRSPHSRRMERRRRDIRQRAMTRPLRIALAGTRGVPARYSGFERVPNNWARRLVERGHEVTVYCRPTTARCRIAVYRGMRRIVLPTVRQKYLDTLVHATLSTLDALARRFDVVLYFIAGNSPLVWIPRLVGTRTVLNVDGLDWRRDKWPAVAKQYLQLDRTAGHMAPERLRHRLPRRAGVLPRAFSPRSDLHSIRIRAGPSSSRADARPSWPCLRPIRALRRPPGGRKLCRSSRGCFSMVRTDFKCVVVGGASYADDYIRSLRRRPRRTLGSC